jgi:hypothetical protein
MPFGYCGGNWGPTGLTADDLWDVSRRGTAEVHVDWGGYWDPFDLPIDPDEAPRSDHLITVDMPLSTWGETKICL